MRTLARAVPLKPRRAARAWQLMREGKLKRGATLLHIDSHHDMGMPDTLDRTKLDGERTQ